MRVDHSPSLRFDPGDAPNAGDAIAIDDDGSVRLDLSIYRVDNVSVGNGKSLRVSANGQQSQTENKPL